MAAQRSPLASVVRPVTPPRLRGFVRWLPMKIGYRKGPLAMSWLRKQWVLLRHPHGHISFGKGVYLGPRFSLHMPDEGTFIVGDGVEFRRGFRAEISGRGKIVIGSGCYFTYDVVLACSTEMVIGERCGMGQATFVADGNHRYRDLSKPFLDQGYTFHPMVIEDDVQIHSKCTILASIGTRTVIGANAVVTKPLPPYALAAGVPARVIDHFGPSSEQSEQASDAPMRADRHVDAASPVSTEK